MTTMTRTRTALVATSLAVLTLAAGVGLGAGPAGAGAPPYCEEDEVTLFVCKSYISFVRRSPTEAEVDYWAPRMPAQKTVFLSTLGRSAESRRRAIERYYDYFAEIEAGDADLAYWEGEVQKPNGFRRLEAALLTTYEGISYVSYVYEAFTGREPNDTERLYWEGQVALKGENLVAADIGYSVEARNVRVRWAYQNELGYFPDTASRDYWAGRLRTGTSYLELRIALKTVGYPGSSGACSTPAPFLEYGCL